MECELILLAEDDPEDAELARRAFKKHCFVNPLFIVSDGSQVISYLLGEGKFSDRREYPLPSLLIVDLQMPVMNGFDVIRWVRAHDTFKSLPIVVLTTSDNLSDVNSAYSLGANSFMVKPVDFTDFVGMGAAVRSYWLWVNTPPRVSGVIWHHRLG